MVTGAKEVLTQRLQNSIAQEGILDFVSVIETQLVSTTV